MKFIFNTGQTQLVFPIVLKNTDQPAAHARDLFRNFARQLEDEKETRLRAMQKYTARSQYFNKNNQVERFPKNKVRIVK